MSPKDVLIGLLMLSSLMSVCEAFVETNGVYSDGRCHYSSLISYYPPHYVVCELLEQRWK